MIHKFKNQNIKAQANKKIAKAQTENFLFLYNKKVIGGMVDNKAQIVTDQFDLVLNISE